jgi:hypothetical protein
MAAAISGGKDAEDHIGGAGGPYLAQSQHGKLQARAGEGAQLSALLNEGGAGNAANGVF